MQDTENKSREDSDETGPPLSVDSEVESHTTALVESSFTWNDGFVVAEIDPRCVRGSSCQNVHGKLRLGCWAHEATNPVFIAMERVYMAPLQVARPPASICVPIFRHCTVLAESRQLQVIGTGPLRKWLGFPVMTDFCIPSHASPTMLVVRKE